MFHWLIKKLDKPSSVVGLDLGSSAIKLLQLSRQSNGRYRVDNYAIMPFRNELVMRNDQELCAQKQALALLQKQFDGLLKNVVVAVPSSVVISKVIQVNAELNELEIEQHIALSAERYISYPFTEINVDFQLLDRNSQNPRERDVLLVASHKKHITAQVDLLAACDITAKIVDVQCYALERAYELLAGGVSKNPIAIVDIGVATTTLVVLSQQNTVFTHSELMGGVQLTEALMQHYGYSYARAELIKKDSRITKAEPVFTNYKQQISLLIQRLLQLFYSTTGEEADIQQIYITGGTALLPDLSLYLTKDLGIETLLANPFIGMDVVPTIAVNELNKMGSNFLLSCGLALHGFMG